MATPMKPFNVKTACAVLVVSGTVVAHEGASGIVAERMDAMSEFGDVTQYIGDMFKGRQVMDRDTIGNAARLYIKHGDKIPMQFPDTLHSRTSGNTEALDAIWERREAFDASAREFVARSRELLAAYDRGAELDELKAAFYSVARGCRECHDDFRAAQD